MFELPSFDGIITQFSEPLSQIRNKLRELSQRKLIPQRNLLLPPCDLHQAQSGPVDDLCSDRIVPDHPAKLLQELSVPVRRGLIDKINQDDAGKVAESDLTGSFRGRLQIHQIDGLYPFC